MRNYDRVTVKRIYEASCAQGPTSSSPRREICRVVLALNHSKRTNGPLVELNERVNSEKSVSHNATRVTRRGSKRRGRDGLLKTWIRSSIRGACPHVSSPFLPMRHFDAIWDERGCPSFRQYPLLFSLLPFRFNRPPLYSVTLYSLFLFFLSFFFNRNLSRSLLLLYTGGCSSWIVDLWNIGATISFLSIPPSRRDIFHPRRDDSSGLCWSPQREIHGERTGYINKIYLLSFKCLCLEYLSRCYLFRDIFCYNKILNFK